MADSEDLQEIRALAAAIRRVKVPELQLAMAECLLSKLEDHLPEAAQLAGSLLAGIGEGPARQLGQALLDRTKEFSSIKSKDSAHQVDMVILTIKEPELEACLAAFEIAGSAIGEQLGRSGMEGWYIELSGRRILITMAGSAGNVATAVAMAALRPVVRTRMAILVGTAAGLRSKVNVGDVVVAELVGEYEFARMTNDGALYQPRWKDVRERYFRSAELHNRNDPTWRERCQRLVRETERPSTEGSPTHDEIEHWSPRVHRGVTLTGGQLLEDGSLPKLREDLHDRVRAAEMEGGGFAAACREDRIDWAVVRGISDYGETERVQGWQFAATVAAATFVRTALARGLYDEDPADQ